MAIRGVTYNDDGTPGAKTPALFLADLDLRYITTSDVAFGTTAGTYCEGNDSRLSDARTPTNLSVSTGKLQDASVTIAKISATGTPSSTKFLRGDGAWVDGTTAVGAGAVDTVNIVDNAVTNAKMADNAIGNAELADNAVHTAEINDAAVTNAKIADGTIALAKLSATGTPSSSNYLRGDNTWQALPATPYDVYYVAFGGATTRATGTGDNPMGIKLQRSVTFTSVTYRLNTAGASGNCIVELRKNGSTVSGTSVTMSQSGTTSGSATGSWSFSSADVLTVYVTTADTTPGTGLVADITGST